MEYNILAMIAHGHEKKLVNAGITSIEDLLRTGATSNGRKTLVELTGLMEKCIIGWLNRADLSRIRGIGAQYALLLECAGVNNVSELASRNGYHLYQALKSLNADKRLVRMMPSLPKVEDWVSQAKHLPRAIYD